MGNSNKQQSSEYGGILMKINNCLEYFSGETISGQIYLEIKKAFPGNQIVLQIKGREKVRWEREFRQDKTTYIATHWGKKYFYNNSVVIYQFNGSEINMGQYVFPFSFVLQQNLPPTFFWERDRFDYAKNDYRLIAKLASFDSKLKFHHHETFFIKSQLLNIPQQVQEEQTIQLKTWCCKKQGQVTLRCFIDKNALIPGENVQVIVEINNGQGKIDIKQIQCDLKQELELYAPHDKVRAKYSHNPFSTLLVSAGSKNKKYIWNVDNQQLEGVKAGDGKKLVKMHLEEDKHNFPTFQSEYIKNSYFIDVQGKVDGCTCGGCCGPIPEIKIPVSVANAVTHQIKFYKQKTQQFEQDLYQQYQENWNPEVLPNQQLIFNNTNFVQTNQQNEMHNYDYNYNPMMNQMNNQNVMQQQYYENGYVQLKGQQ